MKDTNSESYSYLKLPPTPAPATTSTTATVDPFGCSGAPSKKACREAKSCTFDAALQACVAKAGATVPPAAGADPCADATGPECRSLKVCTFDKAAKICSVKEGVDLEASAAADALLAGKIALAAENACKALSPQACRDASACKVDAPVGCHVRS